MLPGGRHAARRAGAGSVAGTPAKIELTRIHFKTKFVNCIHCRGRDAAGARRIARAPASGTRAAGPGPRSRPGTRRPPSSWPWQRPSRAAHTRGRGVRRQRRTRKGTPRARATGRGPARAFRHCLAPRTPGIRRRGTTPPRRREQSAAARPCVGDGGRGAGAPAADPARFYSNIKESAHGPGPAPAASRGPARAPRAAGALNAERLQQR